jgi:hypothetical protein
MSRPARSKAQPPLVVTHFQESLVLNQYLISLLGIDPLAAHSDGGRTVRPLEQIAKSLRAVEPGIAAKGKHRFLEELVAHLPKSAALSVAERERFDANLVAHTQAINARRKQKGELAWKYFQWLSLLFVEIYLDRYFNDRQGLEHEGPGNARPEQVAGVFPGRKRLLGQGIGAVGDSDVIQQFSF